MNVYLFGAKNVEIARQIRAQKQANPEYVVKGFLDNDPARHGSFIGFPVFGGLGILSRLMNDDPAAYFVNLITGSTEARYEVSRDLAAAGCRFTNLIHPSIDLSDVTIGVGNYIQDAECSRRSGDRP
jgi:hypothetical protein